VVPLRRCTQPVRREAQRSAPCAAAQLGVSLCPCAGGVDAAEYRRHVDRVVEGLTRRPELLLEPLRERMDALAREERFEEAGATRVRLAALASALRRQRRMDQLLACDRLVLTVDSGERAELRRGVLWQMWAADSGDRLLPARPVEMQPDAPPDPAAPVTRELADELSCVGAWLDRHAGRVRVEAVDGPMASALPALPTFEPRRVRS
jgi:DNA polymerase-3 subunit epsilon